MAQGIWGPVTSTLDWCEANYQFSNYIAEMANTLSNLVSIAFALYGVFRSVSESFPIQYTASYAGFALVGVGSFAFHATLLYEAQLADELPMILVASYTLYLLFDTDPGFSLRTFRSRITLATMLVFNFLFSWSYFKYRNPVYHQVVFALLMFGLVSRTAFLLNWSNASLRISERTKKSISRTYSTGSLSFAFAFLIWNLDNIYCDTITKWKIVIGWPAAFALEGHSWWHVMTAVGTYLMLVGDAYLCVCIKDDDKKYALAYYCGLPHLRHIQETKKR